MADNLSTSSFELCSFIIEPPFNAVKEWSTFKAKVALGNSFFLKAQEQAFKKAQHTMNASQAGLNRDAEKKYQSQLRGTLAEIYVQELFLENFKTASFNGKKTDAIRYDDVRTDDFKEPAGEYDIKVIIENKVFYLESRSSVVHDRSFIDGLKTLNMIGSYVSSAKFSEKTNDFYILPLYRYLNFANGDFYEHSIEGLFEREAVELHLVVAATNKLFQQKGQVRSLGQIGTKYNVLQILDGYQLTTFFEKLSNYSATQS